MQVGELIRLGPEVSGFTTKMLTAVVLKHTNAGNRVQFLVPAGTGEAVIARVRVKISRLRGSVRAKQASLKDFQIRAESYPFTQNGIRYDAVVMWQYQTRVMQMMNQLQKGL